MNLLWETKKNRRIIDEKTHNDTQGANMPKMRLKFKPEVKQSVFKENLNLFVENQFICAKILKVDKKQNIRSHYLLYTNNITATRYDVR